MRKPTPRLAALALGLLIVACASPSEAQGARPRQPYPWLGRGTPAPPVYPPVLLSSRDLLYLPATQRPLPVDLREAKRFARGHLPGARRLDFGPALDAALAAADPGRFATWLAGEGIAAGDTLLLYGDEQSTLDLARLAWALEWAGHPLPRLLDGGVAAWARQGGELVTDPPPSALPCAPASPDSLRPALAVDSAWIAAHMGQVSECEILDLRGERRWRGLAGHIPHALPYDFEAELELPGDASWPDPPAARQRFAALGPRPRDTVDLGATFVLSGEDGTDARPLLGALLLRMMGLRAAVHLGGWTAWRSDPAAPVTRLLKAEELRGLLARDDPALADQRSTRLPLLDLRGLRDYQLEHLPGAVALPAHTLDDSLSVLLDRLWPALAPASDSLVVYCYGVDCVRSRIAATKAARLGWRRVLVFQGGLPEWRAAGLPLYGSVPEPSPPRARGGRPRGR